MIVDSHVHASPYWFEPVETLLYEMNVNGVGKALLVQIASNYNNDYILECMRRYPGRFAACIVVDTSRQDAPSKLEECVEKGATGVRLLAKARLTNPKELGVWRKANELGLAASIFGGEEDFASDEFRHAIEMFPDMSIVIEHNGSPGKDEQAPYTLYRRVLALAQFPNTYMKLGGLGELCHWVRPFRQPNPLSEVPPLLKMAIDAFGPQRLMFGSDFPPVAHREGYRNALMWLRDELSYLKQEDPAWIFGKTALSVWNFPDGMVP
jgi:L-fuconolactonase